MTRVITSTMVALFAAAAISNAAPNKEAIIAKEKATWQAFKDKKADEFKKLISADLTAVYADGMHNMQQELAMMPKSDMKSFELTDFNVMFPDSKVAIVTYKAKVEGTSEGKDVSGTYNAASVWHMSNGEWHGVFHSEVKEMPAEKPAG